MVPIKLSHPSLSVPVELFPSGGIKIPIKIPMGIENLLFPIQKTPVGLVLDFLECCFFHSISNGDKIIWQFPSGIGILGFFHRRTIFGPIFLMKRGVPWVCDTKVVLPTEFRAKGARG